MRLTHHTNVNALEGIIKHKALVPMFDCVWFTTDEEGENTAGAMFPEEIYQRARVIVEVPDEMVNKFNDISDEFPHLNVAMLNIISDTDKWYVSDEPITSEYFVSTDIMLDGEWSNVK